MLRSMSQAVYSPDNKGHFGLAFDAYAHFTSPIRRYPDLLVHRAIRHVLDDKPVEEFRYSHEEMVLLGEHCSMTERRADEATRNAMDWLKCEFMMDKVGETFEGVISSVTGFGIFVELKDIFVEGLIHVTAFKNDYYHFDPVHHRMVGERTRKIYRLGDPIQVLVTRVDLDDKKIDFDLVLDEGEAPAEEKPRKKKRRGKKKKS
jgi:ribonuclease R